MALRSSVTRSGRQRVAAAQDLARELQAARTRTTAALLAVAVPLVAAVLYPIAARSDQLARTPAGRLVYDALGLIPLWEWLIIVPLLLAVIGLDLRRSSLGRRLKGAGRLSDLMTRHRCDEATATRIARREVWEGMTEAMLRDSLGDPMATDQKWVRGRRREVWKYNPVGLNWYAKRIVVEDGVVTGWDANG